MEHTNGEPEVYEWEKAFDLGLGFASARNYKFPIVPAEIYVKSPWIWAKRVIVSLPHAHGYVEKDIAAYDAILDPVRDHLLGGYHADFGGAFRVAVHMRRGDVQPSDAKRYTPDDFVLRTIGLINVICRRHSIDPEFHVYSQGTEGDFVAYCDHVLHLDENPIHSLRGLATADLLVMAKSSFSYVAALLSQGIVVYEPFWHKPRSSWIGARDYSGLERRIAASQAGRPRSRSSPNHEIGRSVIPGARRQTGRLIRRVVWRQIHRCTNGHLKKFLYRNGLDSGR